MLLIVVVGVVHMFWHDFFGAAMGAAVALAFLLGRSAGREQQLREQDEQDAYMREHMASKWRGVGGVG